MGRTSSRWANLPRGMRARPRGNKVFYCLDTGGKPRKEIPLGTNYAAAVARYAELACRPEAAPEPERITFIHAVEGYRKDVLLTKAQRTQRDNEKELAFLLRFFDGDNPAPLDEIQPVHVRQYMRWRVAEARRLALKKNPVLAIPDTLEPVQSLGNYEKLDG